jgi:hypothetical protein
MKKKNLQFKFNPKEIIESNLTLPSIQKTLVSEYKIFKPEAKVIFGDHFLNYFKTWQDAKKDSFIKLISGKVNFHKVKKHFIDMGAYNENKNII